MHCFSLPPVGWTSLNRTGVTQHHYSTDTVNHIVTEHKSCRRIFKYTQPIDPPKAMDILLHIIICNKSHPHNRLFLLNIVLRSLMNVELSQVRDTPRSAPLENLKPFLTGATNNESHISTTLATEILWAHEAGCNKWAYTSAVY